MKKMLSFLLITLMVVGSLPTFAVEAAEATEVFKAVGALTTGTRVIGKTQASTITPITFSTGDELPLLSDNMRHSWREYRIDFYNILKSYANAQQNTGNYIKLTQTDTGVEWVSTTPKNVSRVDIWLLPSYSINEYALQTYDSTEEVWKDYVTGDFNPDSATVSAMTNAAVSTNVACCHTILLDKPIMTDKLRFIVKSFTATSSAFTYITEMDVVTTEEAASINMIASDTDNNDGIAGSIYVTAYKSSPSAAVKDGDAYRGWPSKAITADSNGDIWHVVRSHYSRLLFNRVKMNISGGTVSKITVLKSNMSANYTTPTTGENWTEVASISGSFTGNISFDIPGLSAENDRAHIWKIMASGATAGTQINSMGLYSMSNSELADLLNDDIRYTYGERMEKDYSEPYRNLYKFVKFGGDKNEIEWDIPESTSVKRLDFWVWPKNAIDTFEIEKSTDGTAWESVKTGDWNPNGEALGSITGEGADEYDSTYWQSVVLDEAVTDAKKLRFKITGYTDSNYGAYIAEASYGATNNINLLGRDTANNDGQSHSIYVEASHLIGSSETYYYSLDSQTYRGTPSNLYTSWVANSTRTNTWHAVKLAGTGHKINRIAVDRHAGTVKEFEIWCSNSASDFEKNTIESMDTATNTWKKVATVKGNYSSTGLVLDIPNAPAAEYWLIRVTDRDSSKGMILKADTLKFYELAESELASEPISGTLSAGKRIMLALDNYDELEEVVAGTTADIYFALYEAGELVSVLTAADVTFDDSHNVVLYNVPTGFSGTLSMRAFIWSGDGNLKPLAGDISYPAN